MTCVVWKHALDTTNGNIVTVSLPAHAKICHFGYQSDGLGGYGLFIWEAHDENWESIPQNRTFLIAGTGSTFEGDINEDLSFIKSTQVPDPNNAGSEFVFHLFEAH